MSGHVARDPLVKALDGIGEREELTYAQRTSAEVPYPPSVVAERLEALRRDRWLGWGLLVLAGMVVAVVSLGSAFDWPVTEFALGFLPATLALVGVGVRKLTYAEKAEQLYQLLRRRDDVPDRVHDPSVVEAV